MNEQNLSTFPQKLRQYITSLPSEFKEISEERKTALTALSDYIKARQQAQQPIQVTVICTHNSRRSHIGQIWLQIAAYCYGIDNFQSFSGGTEATAFHPNAVVAMRRTGMDIINTDEAKNPVYRVEFSATAPSFELFSKVYDTAINPSRDFAAIMVCDSANEACPIVFGSDARFALTFEDPKAFDGTDLEATKYDERARQIAREFFFVMQGAVL